MLLCCGVLQQMINTLRPRQNGHHFPDDIFKCIFLNENAWISIKISVKFVPKGPIIKIPAMVWITAWGRSGDKPLSEPMMVSLLTHICVTRPQWVKSQCVAMHVCNGICVNIQYKMYEYKDNLYGPFLKTNMDKTLIPTWISNHILSKVCGETTYPFPNFNSCTVEVWEHHWSLGMDDQFNPILYNGYNYLSMLVKGAQGLSISHCLMDWVKYSWQSCK